MINDSVVREIGSGNWFILSIILGFCFVVYFVRELWEKGTGDQRWLAVGLGMICFGSAIRAFLTWMLNIYNLHGWESAFWSNTWPWFALSVLLNSLGCLVGVHLAFFNRTPAEARMRILEGRRRQVEERREGLREAVARASSSLDRYTRQLHQLGLESSEREVKWLNDLIAAERVAQSRAEQSPS